MEKYTFLTFLVFSYQQNCETAGDGAVHFVHPAVRIDNAQLGLNPTTKLLGPSVV